MSTVLVTYATRYGSTAEVAEAIAKRLGEQGVSADVMPTREVSSLDGYQAVVLGAPVYIGSLLKDASAFLEHHRQELERLPVAVFVLGPLTSDQLAEDGHKQLETALQKAAPWLQPVAAEEFAGAYDPAHLRFADKLAAVFPASPLHDVPAEDGRDWNAIAAWADRLPETLGVGK